MYLAEDRIMGLEILAKKNCSYILRYIPGGKAITDSPNTLKSLIKQRRRWHNGSLFASYHVALNIGRIFQRKNSGCRNIFFVILYVYTLTNLIVGFFMAGLLYSSYSMALRSTFNEGNSFNFTHAVAILENLYILFMFYGLIISIAVDIDYSEIGFRVISIFLNILLFFMVIIGIIEYVKQDFNLYKHIFMMLVGLSYVMPIVLHGKHIKLIHFLKGIGSVLLLLPTYINIISLYSISNIHDVSWGSREVSIETTDDLKFSQRDKMMHIDYRNFRSKFLVAWAVSNTLFGISVTVSDKNIKQFYIYFIMIVLILLISSKVLFAVLYWVVSMWKARKIHIMTKTGKPRPIQEEVKNMSINYDVGHNNVSKEVQESGLNEEVLRKITKCKSRKGLRLFKSMRRSTNIPFETSSEVEDSKSERDQRSIEESDY